MMHIAPMLWVTIAAGLLTGHATLTANAVGTRSGVHERTLRVGTLDRTFTVFVPYTVSRTPAVVVVLHGGSGGSGARIRGLIGRELEALAEEHGFLLVYPDGIEGSWNDCRAGASYGAKLQRIDDVAFLRALRRHLADDLGADRDRMFAIGYSNGAHLAFRMALEAPDALRGIAVFGANLPSPGTLDCAESHEPISVLIVNGALDNINPFVGGDVILPDGTRLGRVRSADATLIYFGRLAGYAGEPDRIAVSDADHAAVAGVTGRGWQQPGRADVRLYTVHGGGHTIPSPAAKFPAILGPVERGFSGVGAAVRFFGLLQEPSCGSMCAAASRDG